MKYILIFLCFFTADLSAQNPAAFFDMADDFFQKNTENGMVKYAEIQQNPKALNELLAEAKKADVSVKSPEEFKAFWINAYNLAVISGIVQHYPVSSPLEIDGFFDTRKHSLGRQSLTLDEIEHDLLLGYYPAEERIHFALVCAAKSCPPLLPAAYRPETLEQQLQQQTERAMNDPEFVKVENGEVLFSEILKWYIEDFTAGGRTLVNYANQYRKEKIPRDFKIGFYKYDWELNDVNY